MSSQKHNTSLFSLNLSQKMIGCLFLHVIFYVIAGSIFLKDFKMFNDDVTLLMHAGDLNRLSFNIRLYEKNFIINHEEKTIVKAIEYIDEAQKLVPIIIEELKIMPVPKLLAHIETKLKKYKDKLYELKIKPTSIDGTSDGYMDEKARSLGQELIDMTGGLVSFEKKQMSIFMNNFIGELVKAIIILLTLSGFTITILYLSVLKPLKKIENAAINISKGNFSLVPVSKKEGEIHSVLKAFNKMVTDLEDKQEQLFQAKKLSSIGTLASGTAHQINNPLNNIATSCQLVLTELDCDQNAFIIQMIETIDQETKRAAEIVRCLLEFSRAQTFALELCELSEIVDKVDLLVKSEVPSGITLDIEIPKDISLYIDGQKMVEVLLNLIINSIQAIKKTPGKIEIRAEKDLAANKVIIKISDTGIGIDKKFIPKIFDPFFTTKNADNGTGLGLAVVYGIIKKQNGTIRVESQKGKGAIFIINLPLHKVSDTNQLVNSEKSAGKNSNVR